MYPDRFALLAMLPYGDDTAVAAELERLAGYPGWPGSALPPTATITSASPSTATCGARWPRPAIWSSCIRPTRQCASRIWPPARCSGPGCRSPPRIATRLITSGTLSEVSELRVLLAHAGGALAATIDRLAWDWQMGQLPQLTESPLAIARRAFWVDAIAYAPVPLRAALDIFGTDRMVYGSDYPFAALLSPHELADIDPAALELAATNGKVLLKETTGQRI
jgi:predicted TIM-barrel fold metal-dependent hydrolase